MVGLAAYIFKTFEFLNVYRWYKMVGLFRWQKKRWNFITYMFFIYYPPIIHVVFDVNFYFLYQLIVIRLDKIDL